MRHWKTYKHIITEYWDRILLSTLIATYIFILGSLSIARHNAFASLYDLSNMDQTLWFTLHGHFFSLRYPEEIVSRFAVHADLILVLLSPLYFFKDDVRLLLVSESFFLGIGAIPTYFLSLKVLKDKFAAIIIAAIYLLNPGMQWTDIYDFHGVSLAIPFLLSLFYFAHVKKWKWYWIFLGLSIITKEQISLIIAMTGIFVFFFWKKRSIGILTFLIGIVWFVTMTYIVMPHFTPQNSHWALQDYGEPNLFKILEGFSSPSFLKFHFLSESSRNYYMQLLKPFSFLPLLGFPWLLISLPDFLINIIRETKSINFHYDSGTTPGLILGTIYGIGHVQVILKTFGIGTIASKRLIKIVLVGMLLIALRTNYHYSPLPTTPSCWCNFYEPTKEDHEFENALQNIPKESSITASVEIKPHITHREYAFGIPSATESADYIALITHNRIYGNTELKDIENKLIPILLSLNTHKVIFRSDHFYLFEKIK